MPLSFIRDDLINVNVDVIVHPSNRFLRMGPLNTVSYAIFDKAGREDMLSACYELAPIQPFQAVITPGFKLKAKHVIHVANPRWNGGNTNEEEGLVESYQNILTLAHAHQLKSLATPLLSSGSYRFPKSLALKVALNTIQDFLLNHEMDIYLVVYDNESFNLSKQISADVSDYLSVHTQTSTPETLDDIPDIKDLLKRETATFSNTLYNMILDKDLKDSTVYKNANLSKQHYHKIMKDQHYQPKAATVLAFCISLRTSIEEATTLMKSAGFVFPRSKQDYVVYYCLLKKIFVIDEVNLLLDDHKLPLIGNVDK